MNSILYGIAIIFIIIWLIGFFGYNAGAIIHVLLLLALIAVILRVIRGSKPL